MKKLGNYSIITCIFSRDRPVFQKCKAIYPEKKRCGGQKKGKGQ